MFCKAHATEGMVNVKSKRCAHPDPCGKQHFREIATPDWVGTLRTCFILVSMFRS
jgi:hypothetical protein